MEFYDLFYKWVPVAIRLPVLLLLTFAILVCNGIYLGNITDMYSGLAEYPEPFTMATNSLYIGMGLGLMTGVKLRQRFPAKSLLLVGLLMMLALNLVCATTTHPGIMVAAVLLLGYAKMTALAEVFILWLVVWSKKLDISRVYPFIYFVALAGLYFTTWFMSRVAYKLDWRMAYWPVIVLLSGCMVLTIVFAEKHPLKRVITLWQVDWTGVLLFTGSMMFLNYVFTYGKTEDWFNSERIMISLMLGVFLLLLFSRTQFIQKRPLIRPEIFQRYTFREGLMYFLLLGMLLPSTFQTALSGGILQYESFRNASINLYMLPGILAGAVVSFIWYYKGKDGEWLIWLGMICFLLYHYLLYQTFSAQFAFADFVLPSLLKGFALTLLYIAIGLHSTKLLPPTLSMTASGVVIIIRSFLTSAFFTGLYNYLLYTQRIRHFEQLSHLASANNVSSEPSPLLYQRLQQQATLAAAKEMTGWILIIVTLGLISILVYKGWRSVQHRLITALSI